MIYTVALAQPDTLDEFRSAARILLAANIPPEDIAWTSGNGETLFAAPLPTHEKPATVPRAFAELAAAVICHRDQRRWSWLYEALWRIDQGDRALMQQTTDPLVHRLRRLAVAVKHDQHRMTAFVRFRKVEAPSGDIYIAWYQPQHHVLRRTASFFIDRFASMRFSILTPDLTLQWDGTTQHFAPGLQRHDAPTDDAVEEWWVRYYRSTFNPARINTRLMQSHMPRQFWRDLPEAAAIADLIETAGSRTEQMLQTASPISMPARSLPTPCSARSPQATPPASDVRPATGRLRNENPDTPARTPQ